MGAYLLRPPSLVDIGTYFLVGITFLSGDRGPLSRYDASKLSVCSRST